MPIIPTTGPASLIGPLVENAPKQSGGAGGNTFGAALGDAFKALEADQAGAASQSQALATGQATDLSSVVMSVEKASLEVQLATQVRSKVTDAFDEIMRMQV